MTTKFALVDDALNVMTTESILMESEGYTVSKFSDGEEALESFQDNLPDLAVLDIKMLRIVGKERFNRLRWS